MAEVQEVTPVMETKPAQTAGGAKGPATEAADTGAADRARAERVAGLINAIMANPSLATLQAALGDPEIMAVAMSDSGIAVLVGALTGAVPDMQAKELLTAGKQNPEQMVDKLVETVVAAKAEKEATAPEAAVTAAIAAAQAGTPETPPVAMAAAVTANQEAAPEAPAIAGRISPETILKQLEEARKPSSRSVA